MEGKFEEIDGVKYFVTDDDRYQFIHALDIVNQAHIFGSLHEKKTICHKDINYEGVYIEGELDLSNVIFLKPFVIHYSIFSKNIVFTDSHFEEAVDFSDSFFEEEVNFFNSRFKGKTDFFDSLFEKVAYFTSSHFEKMTSFYNILFKDDVVFTGSHFEKEIYFTSSHFEKAASFFNILFKDNADFTDSYFKEVINFTSSRFEKNASFSSSQFAGESASFFLCECKGLMTFCNTTFDSRGTDFSEIDISGKLLIEERENRNETVNRTFPNKTYFHNIHLTSDRITVFRNIDLSSVSFTGSDIVKMDFRHVHWQSILFKPWWLFSKRNVVYDEERICNPSEQEELRENRTYQELYRQYRELRLSLEGQKDYSQSERFYLSEMLARIKMEPRITAIILWLFGLISDFGFSIVKPLIMLMLCIFLLFPCLYSQVDLIFKTGNNQGKPVPAYSLDIVSYSLKISRFSKDIHVTTEPTGSNYFLLIMLNILQFLVTILFTGLFLFGFRKRFRR